MSEIKSELTTIIKDQQLNTNVEKQLLEAFGVPYNESKEILSSYENIVVTNESQTSLMEEARKKRLFLQKVRTGIESKRKELKDESLKTGQGIDKVASYLKDNIKKAEDYLAIQEKFAENLEREKKARISAERLNILLKLTDTPSMYSYEIMEQTVFEKLVADLTHDKEVKAEAIRKAENDRIAAEKAEAMERERINKENAKLRAEAEVREKAAAEERAIAASKQKEIEEKAAADLAVANAKLAKERQEREAAEKIEADRKAAEIKRLAEIEEQKRKALLAPDKEKLLSLADLIDAIELPALSNHNASKILDETKDFLNRITKNLRTKAKDL